MEERVKKSSNAPCLDTVNALISLTKKQHDI